MTLWQILQAAGLRQVDARRAENMFMTGVTAGSEGRIDGRTLLALVEEKTGTGVWFEDLRSGQVQWSQGVRTLLGLAPHEAIPDWSRLSALVHPQDRHRIGALLAPADRRPEAVEDVSFRIIRHNGAVRWLACRTETICDHDGSPAQRIGILADETARIEAQRRRDCQDRHQFRLAQALSTISWVVHADGTKPDVPYWRVLTGQSVEEARGRGWLAALHPDDREATARCWDEAFSTGKPYCARYRLRLADGRYRWFVARAAPVLDEQGAVSEWVGTCIDAHESVLAEEARLAAAFALAGAHLRAGRGFLNWSVRDLADRAGVSAGVIRRLETLPVTPLRDEPGLQQVCSAMEACGVLFEARADGTVLVGWREAGAFR